VGSRLWPRLKVVRMGAKWVSRDPQTVAEFRSDPLVFHRRFPVRMGAEILRAAAQIRAQAAEIRVPLLILQGTADRAVDPAGSRQLYACAASEDKTLRLYEGLYHDLLHEPERQQVTADLIEWLNRRR
jgi:acylglycerol lipase